MGFLLLLTTIVFGAVIATSGLEPIKIAILTVALITAVGTVDSGVHKDHEKLNKQSIECVCTCTHCVVLHVNQLQPHTHQKH